MKMTKKQSFDINHVTAEQAKELSLFAADLINQARKLVGTTPVAVTAESAIEAQSTQLLCDNRYEDVDV